MSEKSVWRDNFPVLGKEIGQLVEQKNAAYGNAFEVSAAILRQLYPNGVTPDQYVDMLCITRFLDKMKRIATDKDAFGESPYGDIAGYALLGLNLTMKKRREQNETQDSQEVPSDALATEPAGCCHDRAHPLHDQIKDRSHSFSRKSV